MTIVIDDLNRHKLIPTDKTWLCSIDDWLRYDADVSSVGGNEAAIAAVRPIYRFAEAFVPSTAVIEDYAGVFMEID